MRVCWDAEVGVRAPWGALSGQNSDFLPISRMITGLSDATPRLGRLGALDGQAESQGIGQRSRDGADQADVTGCRAEIRDVERSFGLALAKDAGRDDLVVADELSAGADAFAIRLGDGGGESHSTTRPEQAEGDAEAVKRGERPTPVDDERNLRRERKRLGRRAELGEHGRLESGVGRAQPRDAVTNVRVDVRVVLGEDLGDAVAPAE